MNLQEWLTDTDTTLIDHRKGIKCFADNLDSLDQEMIHDLWHLNDYVVSSIRLGIVWLSKRKLPSKGKPKKKMEVPKPSAQGVKFYYRSDCIDDELWEKMVACDVIKASWGDNDTTLITDDSMVVAINRLESSLNDDEHHEFEENIRVAKQCLMNLPECSLIDLEH